MSFRVATSTEAEGHAKAVLEWLLPPGAGETGIQWFRELEQAVQSPAESPERCALAPEGG
jgi:hypothetical protein